MIGDPFINVKKQFWKVILPYLNDSSWVIFSMLMGKKLFYSIGESMCINALNILIVRMQNVDYVNKKSIKGALKDLVMVDRHRMFYRGLLPIGFACTYLRFFS